MVLSGPSGGDNEKANNVHAHTHPGNVSNPNAWLRFPVSFLILSFPNDELLMFTVLCSAGVKLRVETARTPDCFLSSARTGFICQF